MTLATNLVLVGCGHLGRYHLQKVMAHPAAHVVAVVEPCPTQAAKAEAMLRAAHGGALPCPIVGRLQDVDARAHGAIVATPTQSHEAVTLQCFARGWHVLVEKPMAHGVEAAEGMVWAAHKAGCLLQVGHLERFNPAVQVALAAAGPVRYFLAERLGPFSGRATDVDVVLDLMVHDLDLMTIFVDAQVLETRAVGMPVLTETIDMATARLVLSNGTVAQLSAGRTSLMPSRKLRLFTETGYLSVDCVARTVNVVRREGQGHTSTIAGASLYVPEQDALGAQAAAYIASVAQGAPVRVDGAAGVQALRLAHQVQAAMDHHAGMFVADQVPHRASL